MYRCIGVSVYRNRKHRRCIYTIRNLFHGEGGREGGREEGGREVGRDGGREGVRREGGGEGEKMREGRGLAPIPLVCIFSKNFVSITIHTA